MTIATRLGRLANSERAALFGGALLSLAAVAHAAFYDFVADDAFIALRYAENLIERGELAYNPGERVEGFTSPLWVLLAALGGLGGAPLEAVARLLGVAALVATLRALHALLRELAPGAPPVLFLVPALLVASAAPVAAWAASGLETPLFGLLLTLAVALFAKSERKPSVRSRAAASIAAALATLCRPEGAILVALASLWLLARTLARREWRELLAWAAPIALVLGGYLGFRLAYFGYPLPNTFYVKTSGAGLLERWVGYLGFAAAEFGWLWVAALALSLAAPLLATRRLPRALSEAPGVVAGQALLTGLIVLQLAYLAQVGGDFLDLYRFLAPFLPLAYALIAVTLYRFGRELAGSSRWLPLAAASALVASHAQQQRRMVEEALTVDARSRKPLGLEPLGWTRLYGRRWSAVGRWLHAVRRPGDSMAMGAAGAAPYHAGIPNLDLFGLNDAQIAHHGRVIGNRPGHQRFASMDYILSKAPTFVFLQPEHTPPAPLALRHDRFWNGRGYVEAEMRVEPLAHGAPGLFYQKFLVRAERARELQGRPGFRARWPAEPGPRR